MTLIKSISGIRGTIGGQSGESLTPVDIVKFASGFGEWIKRQSKKDNYKVVIGRDGRISGNMVKNLIIETLVGLGINIIDIDYATTPTVELQVTQHKADGGVIITASHNPKQWNALKLLNNKGEFLNDQQGKLVLQLAETGEINYADVDNLGKISSYKNSVDDHVDAVLKLALVDKHAIEEANFTVVVDCINSVGAIALPKLLTALGVQNVHFLNETVDGHFAHNPEPLPENVVGISNFIKELNNPKTVGFVVDPDVDRLAMLCEDGSMFGEEYTLVAVADYVLSHTPGCTVSNLSSSRALRDIAAKHLQKYFAAAVGEVNVVDVMKKNNAIIGGEGNGGVIYPEIHYGRDALVGIALFLTHLAKSNLTCSQLHATYPNYFISKNKIELTKGIDVDSILEKMKTKYKDYEINDSDGVRIDFKNQWVHLRKSNTEPIIRIYAESANKTSADKLANDIIADIKKFI